MAIRDTATTSSDREDDQVPTFNGAPGENVFQFIRDLQTAAFSRGLEPNDNWIARYASTVLGGSAFEWWCSLDDHEQDVWYNLRRALVAKFNARPTTPAAAPSQLPAPGIDVDVSALSLTHSEPDPSTIYVSTFDCFPLQRHR